MDNWFNRWEELVAEWNEEESPYLVRLGRAQLEYSRNLLTDSRNYTDVGNVIDVVQRAINSSLEEFLGETTASGDFRFPMDLAAPAGYEFTEFSYASDPADRNTIQVDLVIRPRYPLNHINIEFAVSGAMSNYPDIP